MSVKVILFGDTTCLNNTLTALRCAPAEQEQEIRVENVQAGLTNYLLFVVKDISLVMSQAAGTAGLICFFAERNVTEIRDQLSSMLSKSKQLEGIPLVIGIHTSSKNVSMREIMSQLEQLKVKDRMTLIKEVDFESKASIEPLLEWVSAQRTQASFDAQPRVVKAKPKYREEPEGDKTYQTLMKDKKFKAMSSINQEGKYLTLEKERIKEINMQEQLAKFTKNKEKMTPYDIKPSPNPRIEPNLNFFLKDIQDDKPQETSIKIQTDEFKPKPPSPKYVPKKTGIDCSTQVQDNQLFDFDREVEPILNVLTIRTLEQAVLDIEEEEEMFKMAKYRELYEYKKKQEKNLHRQYLLAQEKIMRQKEELLKKRKARHDNKLNCFKKVQAYRISRQFTSKIYTHTMDSLATMGFIPNQMQHQLHTDYLHHLLNESRHKLHVVETRSNDLLNCFDEDCILPLIKAAEPRKKERQIKSQRAQKRRLNMSQNQRAINLFFSNQPTFGQFVLNFSQHFDGTQEEYQKSYNEKLKEIQGKVTTGEMPEDGIQKFKQEQLLGLIKQRQGILLDNGLKYGFVLSHNQHEPTEQARRVLSLRAVVVNENGDVLEEVSSNDTKASEMFQINKELRDSKKKINFDQGLEFDLRKLENAAAILFFIKITDLQKVAKPESDNFYKHAAFGFESSTHAVPIMQKQLKEFNILEFYKPEEQKTEQSPIKSSILVPFVLAYNKKLKGWYLQSVNYLTKPMTLEEENNFKGQVLNYWRNCAQQQKDAEEQDQLQQVPKEKQKTSRQGKRDRRKSKQEEPPKKQVTLQETSANQPPLVSRMFPQHVINIHDDLFERVTEILQSQVNHHQQIVKSYPHGWHIRIRGKPFTMVSQLKGYKKLGDLVIQSNPEPVVQSQRNEESSVVEQENQEAV